jgi:hypothetical protein
MFSTVLDRELDEEKSREPSDPRIRCPLCGWLPRKDDRCSCSCGHVRHGRSVPGVPVPVD